MFWCPLDRRQAGLAAEYSLHFLFAYITAFSRGAFLLMDDFERVAPIIGQELERIAACIESTPLQDPFILKQLKFVTWTYSTNLEATEYLRYYVSNDTSQRLLRSIIKLNLYLLCLHDSSGASRSLDHENTLSQAHVVLTNWSSLFHELADLPLGLNALFESQYARAQNTISYLTKSASRSR